MAESETLKRKATVAVNATPAGGGMEEGPFVCHLPSRPDGMPPEGTEWMAWRKNVEFRGHHLVLRGRTRGKGAIAVGTAASAGGAEAYPRSYFVARESRVASRACARSRRRRRCGRERPGVRAGRDAGGGRRDRGPADAVPRARRRARVGRRGGPCDPARGTRQWSEDRLLRAFSSAKRRGWWRASMDVRSDCVLTSMLARSGCDARQPRGGHRGRAGRARAGGARGRAQAHPGARPGTPRSTRTRCGVSRCTPSPIARGGKTCWRRRRSRRSSSLCARTATWTASCWTWCPDWIRLDPTRRRREKPPKRWRSWTRSWRSGRTRARFRSGGRNVDARRSPARAARRARPRRRRGAKLC